MVRRQVAARLGLPPGEIGRASRFAEDLGMTSLTAVELLMDFEEHFGIVVSDVDAARLETVGQAVDYLADRLPRQPD